MVLGFKVDYLVKLITNFLGFVEKSTNNLSQSTKNKIQPTVGVCDYLKL